MIINCKFVARIRRNSLSQKLILNEITNEVAFSRMHCGHFVACHDIFVDEPEIEFVSGCKCW